MSLLTSFTRPASGAYDWIETVPWQTVLGSVAMTANQSTYMRIRPPKTMQTTQCEIFVVSAAGNIDVGVSSRSGTTMTKIVSSGSTAVAGTNAKQVIPLTMNWISGQDYWASIAPDGSPATIARVQLVHSNFAATDDCSLFKSSAFPLANQSSVTGGANVIFWMRFF